jgi:hypothetical protein
VLAAGLLQPRLQGVQLSQIVQVDEAEPADHQHPGADRTHQERVLHFGSQLTQPAEPIQQPREGVAGALALLAGPQVDGDHWTKDP